MNKNIKLFYWFNFLNDFCLFAPIVILYFIKISGSFALGMSILSIAMISSAIFEVPTGIFSDRVGRRKTIIYSSLSGLTALTLYAIGLNYWFLVAGAIFEGLSRSLVSGNNDAYLHDILSEKGEENLYQEYLGKISSMFQLAIAIAAILVGLIASWSFSLVMWISIIPQLIKLIISLNFEEVKTATKSEGNIYNHLKKAVGIFVRNAKLRNLSLSSIIGFGLGEPAYQFRSAFVKTLWPIWAIGIPTFLSSIGAFVSFYFSGKIINKFKEFKILIADKIYSFVVDLISLVFPSVLSPILMSTSSLFYGASCVSLNGLMQKEFSEKQRATMSSLNNLAESLFFGIFALILGGMADKVGVINALLITNFLSLPVMFFYFKAFKKKSKDSFKV